ncbi:unnamed protein product [Candidula unifasciata]|uniref:Uncharacterized protein n=1 Tax=Candidula unifasciata TaxID=100452 RepID=A0A8S3ZWH8_9EUPU|nr:unnamed protein product [Candidula unifasciata]
MSKETTLKFEQPAQPSKLFQTYLKNLKAYESQLDKNEDQKMLDQKWLRDEWLEQSAIKLKARAMKNEQKQLVHEMKMVAKANLLVRRRALALRLETDRQMYEKELASLGKAFHKERL